MKDNYLAPNPSRTDKAIEQLGEIDLLYLGGVMRQSDSELALTPSAWHDLGIERIVAAFSQNKEHQKEIAGVISKILHDPQVIHYRQDILVDLLQNPVLVERLADRFFI